MPLFVVRHEHDPERCPARDPQMGQMLLQHLSPANAANFGVGLRSDAVIDGGHTLFAIVEAPEQEKVDAFFAPFAQAGNVSVMAASPCEVVVERQGC